MEKLLRDLQTIVDLKLTQQQVSAFKLYEKTLLTWNQQVNLTAIRDVEGVRTKHFLDSLTCLLAIREQPPRRLIDIGTGAGFPGIPLKIVCPNMHLTLVESVGKKVQFCKQVVQELSLEGVDILQGRAEEIAQMSQHREQYDWAVARAVALLPTLVEYLLPLVKVGGRMLALKGESAHAEAHKAERAMQYLGGSLRQFISVDLPGVAEGHHLIIIDKIAATPPQYPRRIGIPSKKPLI